MVVIHSDLVDEADIAPWTERKLKIMVVPLNFIRWATDNYWFAFTVDRTSIPHAQGRETRTGSVAQARGRGAGQARLSGISGKLTILGPFVCGPSASPPPPPAAPRSPRRGPTPHRAPASLSPELQALYGNGPFWYAHKVDLWRMWILERFGGVYLDTDVILQKPINRKTLGPNVLGLESGSLQVEKSHEPVVVNSTAHANTRTREGGAWGRGRRHGKGRGWGKGDEGMGRGRGWGEGEEGRGMGRPEPELEARQSGQPRPRSPLRRCGPCQTFPDRSLLFFGLMRRTAAVTALERGSAFAQRCMRLIGRRYRTSIWSSVGPRVRAACPRPPWQRTVGS